MGPLAGLVSAARVVSTPWVSIIACDMPLLPPDWVVSLYKHALSAGARAAYAKQANPNFAAICAVARADTLRSADTLLQAGKRNWAAWLDSINAVPWSGFSNRQLTNINTLSELS
jgi:molybdopterin-guanine dinucleotide biosynthesis protein A